MMDDSFLDVDLESGFEDLHIDDEPMLTTSISDLIHCDTVDMSNMFLKGAMEPGGAIGFSSRPNILLTMVDYVSKKTLGVATEDQCWWDRHPFETTPIGAPLKYHPKRIKTSNQVHLEKNSDGELTDYETTIVETYDDYFETDGIFCSFPCCRAYIRRESKTDRLYVKSDNLLHYMYKKVHGLPMSERVEIPVAGPWTILNGCGGNVPIGTYRHNCCKYIYEMTPNIKRPLMIPVGREVTVRTLN